MALNKIQSIISNLSKDPKVKKVISEVQAASKDIQSGLNQLNKADAVKAYKQIMKKVVSKENELQKTVLAKVKKSAAEIEKNLKSYKKQAEAKRAQFEKMLRAKAGGTKAKPARKAKRTAKRKSSTKK